MVKAFFDSHPVVIRLAALVTGLAYAASAFGWMLAYLRGPDIVGGWIETYAGTDGRMIMFLLVLLFIIIGDFMDAVPAIIIFMPIIIKLERARQHQPAAYGCSNNHHAGFWAHHTALWAVIAGRVKICRRTIQ